MMILLLILIPLIGTAEADSPKPLNITWSDPQNDNKTTCNDRLLKYAMQSTGTKYTTYGDWFGCCSTSNITNLEDSEYACCLTFGSKCNDANTKLRCCREEACCDGRCVLTSGTPKDNSLGGKRDSQKPKMNTVFAFTKPWSRDCSNPTHPLNRFMTYYQKNIYACCMKDYDNSTDQAASKCCLLSNSPCDSSVPCCNDRPCIGGRCPQSAGNSDDPNLTTKKGACKGLKAAAENTMELKFANKTCESKGLSFYAKSSDGKSSGCCSEKPMDAQSSAESCCLLHGSKCDGGIRCCHSLFCCNGMCSENSGFRSSSGVERPYGACQTSLY